MVKVEMTSFAHNSCKLIQRIEAEARKIQAAESNAERK